LCQLGAKRLTLSSPEKWWKKLNANTNGGWALDETVAPAMVAAAA